VDSAYVLGEEAGERGLSRRGQAPDDDEHAVNTVPTSREVALEIDRIRF
jgi:hypothetical protein